MFLIGDGTLGELTNPLYNLKESNNDGILNWDQAKMLVINKSQFVCYVKMNILTF